MSYTFNVWINLNLKLAAFCCLSVVGLITFCYFSCEFGADLLSPIKGLNLFVSPRLCRSRTPALGAALQSDL